MAESIDGKVNGIEIGFIFLSLDGRVYQREYTSRSIYGAIACAYSIVVGGAELFLSPRELLPYQGMILWEIDRDKYPSDMSVLGFKTRRKSPLSILRLLYQELESVARQRNAKYIFMRVTKKRVIPLLKRQGFSYDAGKEGFVKAI